MTRSRARVLLIEDAADIRLALRALLTRAGHEPVEASDGRAGLRLLFSARPDLVVLDIGLPDLDGWEVLNRIRELGEMPVLILSAHGMEVERVRGLRAGADDYVVKPFGNQELLARIEALLRRSSWSAPSGTRYDDGFLAIDHEARVASIEGSRIELTPTEFRLLTALTRRPGVVLSPEQLVEAAWGDSSGTGAERVKYAVLRLRRKIESETGPVRSGPIETLRGFGYRYETPTPGTRT